MTHNNSNLGGGSYVTPQMNTIDVLVEGVLCASYTYNKGGAGKYYDNQVTDNGSY